MAFEIRILKILTKSIPVPQQFEEWMDDISGDLVCQKCNKIILSDFGEYESAYSVNRLMQAVASHFCGTIFNYDFNDPRTIKEQQAAQQLLSLQSK